MGNSIAKYITKPDETPDNNSPPTFDSLYGFPNGRKTRAMVVTEDEMIAAKVPVHLRDYCAHYLLKIEECKRDHYPFVVRNCKHARHEYAQCQFEDYVLRMKEYERERRLLARQKRMRQAEAA